MLFSCLFTSWQLLPSVQPHHGSITVTLGLVRPTDHAYRYNVFSVTLRGGGKAILGYRPDTGDQARTIWLDHNLTLGIKFTFSMSGCPMISSISVTRSRSLAHTSLMLTFLDMSECSALDNTGLTITLLHCPQLTHLYIRKCNNVSGKTIKSDNSAILSLTSQVSITTIPIFFWHNYWIRQN